MQVTEVNDIKIYNLSQGKTIPEWLSDRKRRLLLKKDVDLRRRIQLIQDFDMPVVTNTIDVSSNGQYIIATGVYKPRVRCYDVDQLAMKFERCLDAEVIRLRILSEDYSKLLMLQADRWLELHSQAGHYFRTRIPRFGRDLEYNSATCDALFVGDSREIFRLNLNVGTFLKSFETESPQLNTIVINPVHNLIMVGGEDGHLEAWDPRQRSRCGRLNCSLGSNESVTKLKYYDSLKLACGTSDGRILLYDIRSNRPYFTKDHLYGLPIKSIDFFRNENQLTNNLVATLDSKIIKIWNHVTGEPYTAIQSDSDLNALTIYPASGMMFVAQESSKILAYYLPSIDTAPKWCSFLDRITEELEESDQSLTNTIYDDYKFVTEHELKQLNLDDLIGTDLLRAYMHGFFIDARLYRKALEVLRPFEAEKYRQQQVKALHEAQYRNRVQIPEDPDDQLPKINRKLAEKLAQIEADQQAKRRQNKPAKFKPNPMADDRFAALFTDPNFEIDEQSDEFRLLNPVISRMTRDKPRETTEDDAVCNRTKSKRIRNKPFQTQKTE